MTQEKDRDELMEILRQEEIFWSDFPMKDRFIQKLLSWKRGQNWWCEHIERIEGRWYITQDHIYTSHDWDLCPIQGCEAKRPGESG